MLNIIKIHSGYIWFKTCPSTHQSIHHLLSAAIKTQFITICFLDPLWLSNFSINSVRLHSKLLRPTQQCRTGESIMVHSLYILHDWTQHIVDGSWEREMKCSQQALSLFLSVYQMRRMFRTCHVLALLWLLQCCYKSLSDYLCGCGWRWGSFCSPAGIPASVSSSKSIRHQGEHIVNTYLCV